MTNDLAEIEAPPELKHQVSTCVQWSQENTIFTADHFQETGDHLKTIKTSLRAADEFFDPPIAQAHQLHKMLCQRKKFITDPLTQSERIDKGKMLAWTEAERAKAESERRRLQAISDEAARKEREKIEQAAAKQRAIEAEQRAKAEGARQAEERARRDAEAASAAKRKKLLEEAEAARKEAEAADRKAAAASAKVEVAEEQFAAVVAPVISIASAVPKANGISTRATWKATVVDLTAFLSYVCAGNRHDLVTPNQAVLDALAKGLKEAASMPGVKFESVTTMAASGR